ncbi:MAG: DJ-1/PfpI/YhbO family deglycase/protease, partial [Halobacteria archaeon]|nr:DJ-1/PfpI/YhbO family deglycase/protease [Halobacteria archaeon]
MTGLIITTDGFEDSEFSYPFYRLQEEGFEVDVVTPEGREVEGKHGYTFEADFGFDEYEPSEWADEYDFLVIPGGRAPERLRLEAPVASDIVEAFDEVGKPIASICHGAQLLISAGILEGREVTGYWSLEVDIENAGATFFDEEVVVDDALLAEVRLVALEGVAGAPLG